MLGLAIMQNIRHKPQPNSVFHPFISMLLKQIISQKIITVTEGKKTFFQTKKKSRPPDKNA